MKRDCKLVDAGNPDIPQKPFSVVKNMLMQGTSNNAVINQYKEVS